MNKFIFGVGGGVFTEFLGPLKSFKPIVSGSFIFLQVVPFILSKIKYVSIGGIEFPIIFSLEENDLP